MYTYKQSTGDLFNSRGIKIGKGYAGHGEGVNNTALEAVRDVGPIPRGMWKIMPPIDHPKCGPVSMRLEWSPKTNVFGRDAFLIHGDTIEMNQSASHGCIILNKSVRLLIAQHIETDDELLVV